MTATNHALTGAAIATLIKQPYLAIPLAFASHFLCDALPHFDSGLEFGKKSMYYYLGSEALAMIVLFIVLLGQGVENVPYLIAASLIAMSPDLAWLYYGLKNGNPRDRSRLDVVSKFHSKIQWSATKWGIIPEIFWAGAMISVILK